MDYNYKYIKGIAQLSLYRYGCQSSEEYIELVKHTDFHYSSLVDGERKYYRKVAPLKVLCQFTLTPDKFLGDCLRSFPPILWDHFQQVHKSLTTRTSWELESNLRTIKRSTFNPLDLSTLCHKAINRKVIEQIDHDFPGLFNKFFLPIAPSPHSQTNQFYLKESCIRLDIYGTGPRVLTQVGAFEHEHYVIFEFGKFQLVRCSVSGLYLKPPTVSDICNCFEAFGDYTFLYAYGITIRLTKCRVCLGYSSRFLSVPDKPTSKALDEGEFDLIE